MRYCGERRAVSVRNVLLHLLAPGPFAYDLQARRHSLAPCPVQEPPRRGKLTAPLDAGLLLLSGSANRPLASRALQRRFLHSASGPLLVAALDAEHERVIAQCAKELAQQTVHPVEIVHGYDALAARLRRAACAGIVAAGGDGKEAEPQQLEPLAAAWRAGTALWLADAAAGWAGRWRCGRLKPVYAHDPQQMAQLRAPLYGATPLRRGLGLLPVSLEPRVLEECRWARLLALAYERAGQPALALGAATTLAVTPLGAEVLGEGTLFALDLRPAKRALGENGAYVVANALLDAFAAGDQVTLCKC